MSSKSSKILPYLILVILVATLSAETYLDTDIDLETYMPFLMAIGLGGAGLSVVKSAANAKKIMPEQIKESIKVEIDKLRGSQNA